MINTTSLLSCYWEGDHPMTLLSRHFLLQHIQTNIRMYIYIHIYGIYWYTTHISCWVPGKPFTPSPLTMLPFGSGSFHPFRTRLVEQWLTLEVAATASVVEVVSFASRAVPMENGLSPSHVMMNVQVGVSRKMGWCEKWRFCRFVKQQAFIWKKGCLQMVPMDV